jgi:hypothetical protein
MREIEAATAKRSAMLKVEFAGTGPKGGPACATVPLSGAGWHVARITSIDHFTRS